MKQADAGCMTFTLRDSGMSSDSFFYRSETDSQMECKAKRESVSRLNRRSFAGVSALFIGSLTVSKSLGMTTSEANPFSLAFAPHPGMFKELAGNDVLDQIKFCHDQGFTAWEHNPMPTEEPALQEKIGQLLRDLKMRMGVFVAYSDFERPTFAVNKPEYREEVLQKIDAAIAVAKRCGATHFTVVPGTVDQQSIHDQNWNKYGGARMAEGYQLANVIDLLRVCAERLEPHKLTMVLEPLNWHANHGGVFLQRSDQAFAICRAVNSPACKILFDIYHQQITEGNLIPNIENCWTEIGYFQTGDNPGRKEPGTGEINYSKVCQYIHDRSMKEDKSFIFGMEHGNANRGIEGEQAVIDAYRAIDPK
jgi:hydroxypyruvate isomerase